MAIDRMMTRLAIVAVTLLASACLASAEPTTTMEVQTGWGGHVRAGTWNPIFITLSDLKPRSAVVEASASEGGARGMRVHVFVTIDPQPRTFTIHLPLQPNNNAGPQISVTDADTGKELAHYPDDQSGINFYQKYFDANSQETGVSGATGSFHHMDNIDGRITNSLRAAFLDQNLLPENALGYDPLALLILTRPDLLHMSIPQQQAIVDWVRAGGTLLLWPGDDPLPRSSPLVDVLPCTVQGSRTAVLFDKDLKHAGLRSNFANLRGRMLEKAESIDAESIPLFGEPSDPQNLAWRRRLGLGRIIVAPFNLSELDFDALPDQERFWQPLLKDLIPAAPAKEPAYQYNNIDPDLRTQYQATQRLEDYLGNIKGAGKFGFSYVAIVLLAMMAVVGPIDWFVLKKLGRQPLTWITTAVGIALVTSGAILIGHVFKSGDLHYRSARVVDQADGQTVAETSLVTIYSPRSTEYHLDGAVAAGQGMPGYSTPPAGWWSTVGSDEYSSGSSIKNDFSFQQMDLANVPDAMAIHVWNMKFLRVDTKCSGPARISATLSERKEKPGAAPHVTGTIQNLTASPLLNVRVRCAGGVMTLPIPRIEPNGSVNVDSDLDTTPLFAKTDESPNNMYGNYQGNYSYSESQVMAASELWRHAGDIAVGRSRMIELALADRTQACIYAENPATTPPAVLREPGAVQSHYELIRALVPLSKR